MLKSYNFVKGARAAFTAAAAVLLIGLLLGVIFGYSYTADFGGGTVIRAEIGRDIEEPDFDDIREVIRDAGPGGRRALTVYADSTDDKSFIAKVSGSELSTEEKGAVTNALAGKYGESVIKTVAYQKVNSSLSQKTVVYFALAAAGSMLLASLYFALKLKAEYGVTALICILINVFAIPAVYAITGLSVNIGIIGSVLFVILFSAVLLYGVFDGIADTDRKSPSGRSIEEITNEGVRSSSKAAVLTAVFAFVFAAALAVFGTGELFCFAVPLAAGILASLFTSLFVAAPLFASVAVPSRKPGKKAKK